MERSLKTGVAAAAIAGLALTGCSASASDVPEFDEIEGDMWGSMVSSDAMGMTGVVPEDMASDAPIIEDMLGGDLSDLEIYGSLDDSATAIRLGEDQDPIVSVFGDEVYVSTEMMLETMSSALMADATQAERDALSQMTAEFDGTYIDISGEYDAATGGFDMAELLDEMRSAAEADRADEVTGFNFSELQQEGSYQQLDMDSDDTGWYYSVDGEDENAIMNGEAVHFIAITTDRDAPRLEKVRSGDTAMEFSWDDEVDIPQRPSEDQIVTEQDLMGLADGQ